MHSPHVRRALGAGAVGALLLAGCRGVPGAPDIPSSLPLAEQAPTPGQSARRVATVRLSAYDSAVVDVPATTRAGAPIAVGVTTYGGGCITEDTTVATVAGGQAEIVPYQLVYTPRANEACTAELRITRRSVRLTFAAVGAAQVVVVGRAAPGDSLVRVVRTIAVQ